MEKLTNRPQLIKQISSKYKIGPEYLLNISNENIKALDLILTRIDNKLRIQGKDLVRFLNKENRKLDNKKPIDLIMSLPEIIVKNFDWSLIAY